MKKISLKNLQVDSKEMLTKEQLKNVLGGAIIGVTGSSRCYNRFTHCGANKEGNCESRTDGRCVCNTGTQSWISEECKR